MEISETNSDYVTYMVAQIMRTVAGNAPTPELLAAIKTAVRGVVDLDTLIGNSPPAHAVHVYFDNREYALKARVDFPERTVALVLTTCAAPKDPPSQYAIL